MWPALPYGPVPTLQLHHGKAKQPQLISFSLSLPPPPAAEDGVVRAFCSSSHDHIKKRLKCNVNFEWQQMHFTGAPWKRLGNTLKERQLFPHTQYLNIIVQYGANNWQQHGLESYVCVAKPNKERQTWKSFLHVELLKVQHVMCPLNFIAHLHFLK